MKKIFLIFLALTVFASTFFMNQKKAEAVALPLAVPAAAAVGVYAVGMTTAILLSMDNQKSINENFKETFPQAKEDWKNFSENTKNHVINAYNSYVNGATDFYQLMPTLLNAMQYSFSSSYPEVSGLNEINELVGAVQKGGYGDVTGTTQSRYLSFEGKTLYVYLTNGSIIQVNDYLHLRWTKNSTFGNKEVTLNNFATLYFDDLPMVNILKYTESLSTLINGFNFFVSRSNDLTEKVYISTISTYNTAEQGVLSNKDYWDSQIDKVLKKDNTGAYTLPIPDIYAYPPLAGSSDLPDKSISLGWDATKGLWTLPDGTPFEGTPVVETAPPTTTTMPDGTTVTTIPQTTATGDTVQVDVTTGQTVTTGEGTGEGTIPGEDVGIWDWLKNLLQQILDAIKSLVSSIVNGIASLFIPNADFWSLSVTSINELIRTKLPLIGQLSDFFGAIKDTTFNSRIPEFLIDIPKDWGGGTYPIIDFSYFTEYRTWILNFIRFTSWFIFLKRLYNRIPKIIY